MASRIFYIQENGWRWAWRWADNNEPAFIAFARFPMLHSLVLNAVVDSGLVDNERPVRSAVLFLAQWETWLAFDLCPAIEIYHGSEHTLNAGGLQWKRMVA